MSQPAACRAVPCSHPRQPFPEWLGHIAHRIADRAFDYTDRTARERLALERARNEYPGRAAELRRREMVEGWMRRLDGRQRALRESQ